MKLALHRSITFWSGVLVIWAILLAWSDSLAYCSYAGKGRYGLFNRAGAVHISYWTDYGIQDLNFDRSDYTTSLQMEKPAWVTPVYRHGEGLAPGDPRMELNGDETAQEFILNRLQWQRSLDWLVIVPHWLLLLAVALPWSGLLFWRARRRKRIFTP